MDDGIQAHRPACFSDGEEDRQPETREVEGPRGCSRSMGRWGGGAAESDGSSPAAPWKPRAARGRRRGSRGKHTGGAVETRVGGGALGTVEEGPAVR